MVVIDHLIGIEAEVDIIKDKEDFFREQLCLWKQNAVPITPLGVLGTFPTVFPIVSYNSAANSYI